MRVGVDFDNTIVCYDHLFHRIAVEQGLIPSEVPAIKEAVRNHLRACGKEETWTMMQGLVYGARMSEAAPFPGVHAFFARCRERGVPVHIISHKTRHPFLGPPYDLHQAAHDWLAAHGFQASQVHFELTKADKLKRIAQEGCSCFIDDLPEFLAEAAFPAGVERILFQPAGNPAPDPRWHHAASWPAIEDLVLCRTRRTA